MSSLGIKLPLYQARSEVRQTHDMARPLVTNRPKRRGRQGSDGRSSCRTFVPVVLLGTCIVAVLYGNISFYAEKLYGAPVADPSRPKQEASAENFRADPAINNVRAAEHRSDEALPEPPVVREKSKRVPEGIKAWPAGEGEGGVEAHWDDDASKKRESPTFNGWEEVEVIDALEEAGRDADAVAMGGVSVSLSGEEEGSGESGHEEEPESGGDGGVPSAAAAEQSDGVEGLGEGVIEKPSEDVGVNEVSKGVAASFTPPTSNADQDRTGREEEGGHGDGSGNAGVAAAVPAEEEVGGSASADEKPSEEVGVNEVSKGVAANFTSPTSNADQGRTGREEEGSHGDGSGNADVAAAVPAEEGVGGSASADGKATAASGGGGDGNVVLGAAASSTPISGVEDNREAEQGAAGLTTSESKIGKGATFDASGDPGVALGAAASSTTPLTSAAEEKTQGSKGDGAAGLPASSLPVFAVEVNRESEQEAAGSTSSKTEIAKGVAFDESGDPGVALGAAASSTTPLTSAAEEKTQGSKGDGAAGLPTSSLPVSAGEVNREAEQEAAGSTSSKTEIAKGASFDASGDPVVALGAAASSTVPLTSSNAEQAQGRKGDGDAAGLPASGLELEGLHAEGAERVGGGVGESKGGDQDAADVTGVLDGDAGGEKIEVLAVQFEGGDVPTVNGETHEEVEEGDVKIAVVSPPAVEPEGTVGPDAAGGGAEVEMALNGAVRGSMECATTKTGEGANDIANIATWREVPGDAEYRGPWYQRVSEGNSTRYVTLEKDLGGFNNIRISLECAVAFAAATGRTFVIPAPFMIWNMNTDSSKKEVDLRDLFTFDKLRESGRVRVITMAEFLEKEAFTGNLGVKPDERVMRLKAKAITQYLDDVGRQYEHGLPDFAIEHAAFVMPRSVDERVDLEAAPYQFAKRWLYSRDLTEYQDGWQDAKVIHWRSHEARLLAPFYAFVLHTDEVAERYYKRLMRDLVHFPEEVYCKASQIISLLQQEDPSGSFSSFHVRRNDFMGAYKAVDINPADMVSGSLDHVMENEVVYVATDEKDLSFFDPFREKFRVKFLSDYYDKAGVSELSPNVVGMLEQIIASHGRTFTGCWFSTFTAYILRLRGHLNKPRISNFSYYPPKKTYHHAYNLPGNPLWATEWPFGWEDLDITGVPDATAP